MVYFVLIWKATTAYILDLNTLWPASTWYVKTTTSVRLFFIDDILALFFLKTTTTIAVNFFSNNLWTMYLSTKAKPGRSLYTKGNYANISWTMFPWYKFIHFINKQTGRFVHKLTRPQDDLTLFRETLRPVC
jgi:hypothetical protein